jgi:hypothetical protein
MVLGRKSVAKLKQALGSLMPEMDEGEGLVAAAPVIELREIIDPLPLFDAVTSRLYDDTREVSALLTKRYSRAS